MFSTLVIRSIAFHAVLRLINVSRGQEELLEAIAGLKRGLTADEDDVERVDEARDENVLVVCVIYSMRHSSDLADLKRVLKPFLAPSSTPKLAKGLEAINPSPKSLSSPNLNGKW